MTRFNAGYLKTVFELIASREPDLAKDSSLQIFTDKVTIILTEEMANRMKTMAPLFLHKFLIGGSNDYTFKSE